MASRPFIDAIIQAFEVAGVLALVVGALVAGLNYLANLLRPAKRSLAYGGLRGGLGRAILVGLELLVAADIIRTVAIDQTLQSVAVLGIIVVIRTFLSWSLEVEIDGRWPWQRGGASTAPSPAGAAGSTSDTAPPPDVALGAQSETGTTAGRAGVNRVVTSASASTATNPSSHSPNA